MLLSTLFDTDVTRRNDKGKTNPSLWETGHMGIGVLQFIKP